MITRKPVLDQCWTSDGSVLDQSIRSTPNHQSGVALEHRSTRKHRTFSDEFALAVARGNLNPVAPRAAESDFRPRQSHDGRSSITTKRSLKALLLQALDANRTARKHDAALATARTRHHTRHGSIIVPRHPNLQREQPQLRPQFTEDTRISKGSSRSCDRSSQRTPESPKGAAAAATAPTSPRLMPKPPRPREQTCHAVIVAQLEGVLVALGAAGMHDAAHARVDEQLWAVCEGEERIARGDEWRTRA